MKKSTKMMKRFAALFLVVLMSIESFAAVVSDNDGTAFITQAEFDSLKNSFQLQIDQVNKNIDNKINNAINEYLSGLHSSGESLIKNNKSILTYPVNIKHAEYNWTTTKYNAQTGASRWWTPSFNLFGIYIWANGSTVGAVIRGRYNAENKNKIRTFFNVERVREKCKILGSISDENYWINLNGPVDDRFPGWSSTETGQAFGFYLGLSSAFTRSGSVGIDFTSKLAASGTQLNTTSALPSPLLVYPYFWNGDGSWPSSLGWNSNYTKFTNGSTWWLYTVTFPSFWRSDTYRHDYTLSSELRQLFNAGATTKFLPVAYNGVVYYSNNKNLIYDFTLASDWSGSAVSYASNAVWRAGKSHFAFFCDGGWTLENETNKLNTSHPWYNTSLINHSRAYYDVKGAYSNRDYEQNLLDGILLSEVPAGDDWKKGRINLKMTSSGTAIQKYIVVSESPISQYDITTLDTSALKSLFGDATFSGTGEKLFKITDGENNIYFKDIEGNKPLYFKILWRCSNFETGDNTSVTLTEEPKVYLSKG